jgi:hypothetical protein
MQVAIKKTTFPTGMALLERKGDTVHDHDLDESFRIKIPSHLRKLIEEVVKDHAYKQVLTTLKAVMKTVSVDYICDNKEYTLTGGG